MNKQFNYSTEVMKDDSSIKIYFEGETIKELDFDLLKKQADKYFDYINIERGLIKVIGDVRTIFRKVKENRLFINYKSKLNCCDICFVDKEILKYNNQNNTYNISNYFSYNHTVGISFNIRDVNLNYSDNLCQKIYIDSINELNRLKNIKENRITNDILYINELYKLFYGSYPDYNSKNIYTRIQNMMFILLEYGVCISDDYCFDNMNSNKIPVCEKINDLIDNVKPYGELNSNIIVSNNDKVITKIIRDSIKEVKNKNDKFDELLSYFNKILYIYKYQTGLNNSFEEVNNYFKKEEIISGKCIRLRKKIERNM